MRLQIEPMIWCYAEKVRNYVPNYIFAKYSRIFNNVWAASAFKGASGELTTLTSIQHHYLNHLAWMEIILEDQGLNFTGIALTGWSR